MERCLVLKGGRQLPNWRCPARRPGYWEYFPGVIGLLQAVETINILLGAGDPLVGRLLHYDALAARFVEIKAERDPKCRYCADGVAFPGYADYQELCSSSA